MAHLVGELAFETGRTVGEFAPALSLRKFEFRIQGLRLGV